jgi:anti-sigma factor RsiW
MLTCQQIVDFCFDFLDGSLPEEDQRKFQSHLAACGECVMFFETYRRTPTVSRDALALQMPQGVKQAIRHFLRSRCSDCPE